MSSQTAIGSTISDNPETERNQINGVGSRQGAEPALADLTIGASARRAAALAMLDRWLEEEFDETPAEVEPLSITQSVDA